MSNGAYQIAEINLSYKNQSDLLDRPKITQSKDAYPIFLAAWDMDKIGFVEQVKVLLLNQANRVLGIYDLSTGGVTGTVCDPKLVFAAAIKANACNIILAHNHPSGNLAPSRADRQLTEKIKQAAELFDIIMFDHLIISPNGYYSFSDDATYDRKDLHLDIDKEKIVHAQAETTIAVIPDLPFPLLEMSYEEKALVRFGGLKITSSQTSYDVMMSAWDANALDMKPSSKLLSLDNDCRVIAIKSLPQDVSLASYQDAQTLLSLAAKDNAQFIVLAQNKPYGVILPKVADLNFTDMLNAAGKDYGITMLDHLFVNKNGYYSYNDNEFHLAAQPQAV